MLTDAPGAASAAFDAIGIARKSASVAALQRSPGLGSVAQIIADRVAAEPKTDLGTIATEVAKPYVAKTHVGIPLILITFFADPADVATDARLLDPKLRHAGVAVAQAPANDATRANVIVVLGTP